MSLPLLVTKFYTPPPHPEVVSRPRLIERLNEGLRRRLALLSAPAGFGKTTLISDWLQQIERPSAWLSLDENDNEVSQFFTYFIAALQQLNPGIGQTAQELLRSPQPPPPQTLVTTLINDLAAVSTPFVLVLDDYHAVETQAIHEALAFLLDYLPPQMHLVITSRVDPPLPLARLRGRGQLTELRAADLRFTAEEAATFLNDMMELALAPADIMALEARTEGWITGLQLAALSMQGRQDLSTFVESFAGSHRHILDYLTDEVLQQQAEAIQTFLLQTSILERLCAPLCDALLDVEGASTNQDTLEYLEQANLFVIPLDRERRWYRYHTLFADLLRHRLQQSPTQAGIPELHRRASRWYRENELMAEAIHHALMAGDGDGAAALVEQIAETVVTTMLVRAELPRLLGWLKALPQDQVRTRPKLALAYAWVLALTAGNVADLAEAETYLKMAEQTVQAESDVPQILAQAAAVRAYLTFIKGDLLGTISLAQAALERLPVENKMMQGILAYLLGNAYWLSGEVQAAEQAYARASRSGETLDNLFLHLVGLNNQAKMAEEQGYLRRAAALYQAARHLARQKSEGASPVLESSIELSLAEIYREWNDLDALLEPVTKAVELGQRANLPEMVLTGYIILARVLQAQGQVAEALKTIAKAQQLLITHQLSQIGSWVAAVQARLWLAEGNLAAAGRWVQEASLEPGDEAAYQRFPGEYTTLARVLIAQALAPPAGEVPVREALRLLEQMQVVFEQKGRTGRVIELLALQALALQAQGDTEQAHARLTRAFTLAEPEGYVRVFADEGRPMAELVKQLPATLYRNKLLTILEEAGEIKLSPSSASSQPLLDPLSDRELEVLGLIAEGYANREIAEQLVISFGTVRKHVENIRSKLGVNSRLQAVNRARELGLL